MSGTDRPRRIRAFARQMSAASGTTFTATHQSGDRWTLEWIDGPTPATVAAAAATADLAGAHLTLMRGRTARAYALTTVRLSMSGQLPRQWRLATRQVEDQLYDTEYPERADDDRQARMARRLLDTVRRAGRVETDEIADLVGRRGLGWLLEDDPSGLTALELLTARYAAGDHLGPWRYQARPMPVFAAVGAALADPAIDQAAAAAVLELLPILRADLARIEQAALTAAHRAGVPADTIARARSGEPAAGGAAVNVDQVGRGRSCARPPPSSP